MTLNYYSYDRLEIYWLICLGCVWATASLPDGLLLLRLCGAALEEEGEEAAAGAGEPKADWMCEDVASCEVGFKDKNLDCYYFKIYLKERRFTRFCGACRKCLLRATLHFLCHKVMLSVGSGNSLWTHELHLPETMIMNKYLCPVTRSFITISFFCVGRHIILQNHRFFF